MNNQSTNSLPGICQALLKKHEPEETVCSASGALGSRIPRFDLIPRGALVRLAGRYELGAKKYAPDNWRSGLRDRDYVISRAAHVIHHATLLIAKLKGQVEDDGDDDAAAIMWGGAFLCEAGEAPQETHEAGDL